MFYIKSGTLLVAVLAILNFNNGVRCEDTKVRNCHCAVFMKNDPTGTAIIERAPDVQMECSDKGREDCKKLCAALGQVGKDKARKMVCDSVKDDIVLEAPSVFSRICDDYKWEFTGLSSTESVCCDNGTPVECAKATA